MVATPPIVIATLLSKLASTLSNELRKPHNIRANVFEMPIAEMVNAAKSFSIPPSVARGFIYINGTKKPIIVRNPLIASNMNDGDFNRLISNIVANVRLTASGHS